MYYLPSKAALYDFNVYQHISTIQTYIAGITGSGGYVDGRRNTTRNIAHLPTHKTKSHEISHNHAFVSSQSLAHFVR
jgi:hypothetical protein